MPNLNLEKMLLDAKPEGLILLPREIPELVIRGRRVLDNPAIPLGEDDQGFAQVVSAYLPIACKFKGKDYITYLQTLLELGTNKIGVNGWEKTIRADYTAYVVSALKLLEAVTAEGITIKSFIDIREKAYADALDKHIAEDSLKINGNRASEPLAAQAGFLNRDYTQYRAT